MSAAATQMHIWAEWWLKGEQTAHALFSYTSRGREKTACTWPATYIFLFLK